jgi:mono/diheme cytochrome c family protein
MRKLLKIVGWLVGGLVVVVAVLAATIFVRSNAKLKQTFAVTVSPVPVPTDAAAVARGRHIATTRGCLECHGQDLAGATVFNNGAMGRADAPNLTRGAGGIGATFRDEDYVRAIRHGVAPDGRGLFLMPSADYAGLSDEDMGALLAYLKSVPAVDKPSGPIALGPVARGLVTFGKIRLDAERIDHANVKAATVKPTASAEYGRYLAAGCVGCHGSNYSGGKITIGPPDWPPAANLTPDAAGRLGKWTEQNFFAALRTGKRPDGTEINPVMPRVFGQLDDLETKALWLFLKSLPAAPTGSHD